jgi:patatin-like phospholipase/acyl hydrolase
MKSTDNINMDGIEVHSELLKVLKNFKQGSILESNYVRCNHIISHEMQHNEIGLDVKEISKREMIQRFSSELMEKYKDSFEENETPYGTQLSVSMLVMSASELKHVVEYCVRTMPQSAIEEIRK